THPDAARGICPSDGIAIGFHHIRATPSSWNSHPPPLKDTSNPAKTPCSTMHTKTHRPKYWKSGESKPLQGLSTMAASGSESVFAIEVPTGYSTDASFPGGHRHASWRKACQAVLCQRRSGAVMTQGRFPGSTLHHPMKVTR